MHTMKRTALSILVVAQLFYLSPTGALPRALAGQASPLAAETRATEPVYPLPPPLQVEPLPSAPAAGLALPPETNWLAGAQPPLRPSGRMGCWSLVGAKAALQESHWGYPEQFCVRPFGSYMRAAVVAQVHNGIADQLVLYQSDFVAPDGQPGAELNAQGRWRLERIAALIPLTICPLVIESCEPYSTLDAARRLHVAAALRQGCGDFPEERIVVGRPRARGLRAQEAVLIQQNVLQQIQGGAGSSFGGAIASGTPAGVGSTAASVPGPSVLPGR